MITLEKIKEMNIPVGTPIEITRYQKLHDNEFTELGYYEEVLNGEAYGGVLVYNPIKDKILDPKEQIQGGCYIDAIRELKILKY